jgi:predicted nucleic acid-binding protein
VTWPGRDNRCRFNIRAEAADIKVARGRDFPLADAIIGATAILLKLTDLSDDEHLKRLKVMTCLV